VSSIQKWHPGSVLLWATWGIWFWVVARHPQWEYGTHSLMGLAYVLIWVWYTWCREGKR